MHSHRGVACDGFQHRTFTNTQISDMQGAPARQALAQAATAEQSALLAEQAAAQAAALAAAELLQEAAEAAEAAQRARHQNAGKKARQKLKKQVTSARC